MQTTRKTSNASLDLGSVFTFKSINTFVAPRIVKNVYYVEDCQVTGDNITVDYTLNDEWYDTVISMTALKSFVESTGLNESIIDRSVNGEHEQDCFTISMDTFIAENLNAAVGDYLKAKRIGQTHVS